MRGLDCVVLGGSGAVGTMLAGLLADAGAQVCIVDPRKPADGAFARHLAQDAAGPGPAVRRAVQDADVVVLALPEPVALAAGSWLAPLLRADALLVETLSVKTGIAAVVEAAASGEAVGINPMFAPSLGANGRPVAVVPYRAGVLAAAFLDLLTAAGARLVTVTSAEHDRLAAGTQALTHAAVIAFGQAMAGLELDAHALLSLAPPPCAMLLATLARICSGAPEVYWDIQAANPYAAEARDALSRGVGRISRAADAGNEKGFADVLGEARTTLADGAGPLRELFETVGRHLSGHPLTLREESR